MRVLLIDDDPDLRGLLAHYIRQRWEDAKVEEYDPLSRELPDEAFPLGSYDVVILDYMLGRGDGLDWLQRLKRRAACPEIPFLTGAGNGIIAGGAVKPGADDYQRKQAPRRGKPDAALPDRTGAA